MSIERRPWGGRRTLVGLLALGGLLLAPRVLAAPTSPAPDDNSIDDPKLARRLGTRMDWPGTAAPSPRVETPAPATPPANWPSSGAPSPGTPPVALPPGAPASGPATPPVATAAAPLEPASPGPALAAPPAEAGFEPVLPRVQLAFRRFDFVRIGASDSAGLAKPEAFDSLSLDVYPVSSLIRVGLSTAYGWEEGKTSGGDYFATETGSIGVQINQGRVVPFAEGLAGVGYLRRVQFDRTVPTVLWQLGFDVGASVYFARVGFVSVALGYLHPVNGFAKQVSFESVYTNTWSFKIGVGL